MYRAGRGKTRCHPGHEKAYSQSKTRGISSPPSLRGAYYIENGYLLTSLRQNALDEDVGRLLYRGGRGGILKNPPPSYYDSTGLLRSCYTPSPLSIAYLTPDAMLGFGSILPRLFTRVPLITLPKKHKHTDVLACVLKSYHTLTVRSLCTYSLCT